MMPDGLTARVVYSPSVGGSAAADNAASAGASHKGSGYDLTVELAEGITGASGLTIGGGFSHTDQDQTSTTYNGDVDEQTIYATYAVSGFTLGYQWSEEDLGTASNELSYENTGYGITFAVNDDLSIGYNHYESDQDSTTDVTAEASSFQIAYSMGGASIRVAEASSDNNKYQTAAMYDNDATTVSVSLAF